MCKKKINYKIGLAFGVILTLILSIGLLLFANLYDPSDDSAIITNTGLTASNE